MALGEDEETANGGDLRVDAVGGDEIVLRMPADARFARVARVAVSSLAVRLGFDVTVIEDLRIAVDEALIVLLRDGDEGDGDEGDAGPGDDDAVVMTLTAAATDLAIELRLDPQPQGRTPRPADADGLSRFTELIPPRVVVHDVDVQRGVVRLGLR